MLQQSRFAVVNNPEDVTICWCWDGEWCSKHATVVAVPAFENPTCEVKNILIFSPSQLKTSILWYCLVTCKYFSSKMLTSSWDVFVLFTAVCNRRMWWWDKAQYWDSKQHRYTLAVAIGTRCWPALEYKSRGWYTWYIIQGDIHYTRLHCWDPLIWIVQYNWREGDIQDWVECERRQDWFVMPSLVVLICHQSTTGIYCQPRHCRTRLLCPVQSVPRKTSSFKKHRISPKHPPPPHFRNPLFNKYFLVKVWKF